MKLHELTTDKKLTEKALAEALARILAGKHSGWADLVVHPSNLRSAMKLAGEHNERKPEVRLRALCETRMGHDDWKLKSDEVEVRVQHEGT